VRLADKEPVPKLITQFWQLSLKILNPILLEAESTRNDPVVYGIAVCVSTFGWVMLKDAEERPVISTGPSILTDPETAWTAGNGGKFVTPTDPVMGPEIPTVPVMGSERLTVPVIGFKRITPGIRYPSN
jgi:hypothetical protein